MNVDMTYEKAIKNAAAFKAIGQTKIHLFSKDDEPPWHIASRCEAGSSFRLSISTSAQFHGEQDGLTFTWFFDLEDRKANGTGTTRIDMPNCRRVLRKLKGDALAQFRAYLADVSTAVKKQGDEYQVYADRQYKDAAVLRDLVNSAVEA